MTSKNDHEWVVRLVLAARELADAVDELDIDDLVKFYDDAGNHFGISNLVVLGRKTAEVRQLILERQVQTA